MTDRSVLMLSPSAAWGGAERMADTLRAECEQNGWRTRLALPFDRHEQWNAAVPREVPWTRWALSTRCDESIVHAHLPWPDRIGPALLVARRRPLVVTFQLLPTEGHWPRDRVTHLPSKAMLRAVATLRRDVRWVALSQADARTLTSVLGTRVSVVRNAPPAVSSKPAPLPWKPGALRVLSVGRLDRQKGFDLMLRALAHPDVRALDWEWKVIGEGHERASLVEQARALGLAERVAFVGARPAVDGFVDADLVLSPSRYEGMPLVPLEAAEAGVAALVSSIAPHEELYADVPGCILRGEPVAWASTLVRWFTDGGLRASMRASQRAVLGENPRRAMYLGYEALYRELLA